MKQKVYVGLSGGVDSSVAAAMLRDQGYEVTGVYMKNWTQDVAGVACPWADDLRDARAAAAHLGIPFKVFDFQAQYRSLVVDAMVAEYAAGRTPNPDVLCNQEIKFALFLRAAMADGADLIATGHYAKTTGGRLMRAADSQKDQTYFLYRVERTALERTLFPVGELTKAQVRNLAAGYGLATATKPDSQGICFVGEVGIKTFLQQEVKTERGPVVHNGVEVGRHDGAIFYTIGQRHGLGIGGGRPYYVLAKDMASNTVYVTTDPSKLVVEGESIEIDNQHWTCGAPTSGQTVAVRIRHRGRLVPAVIEAITTETTRIKLLGSEAALAVGQSVVVYDGELVLGGGMLKATNSVVEAVAR